MNTPKLKKQTNPVMIGISRNMQMGAFDVQLLVGNFSTEAEAKKAAILLKDLVERELGVTGQMVS